MRCGGFNSGPTWLDEYSHSLTVSDPINRAKVPIIENSYLFKAIFNKHLFTTLDRGIDNHLKRAPSRIVPS